MARVKRRCSWCRVRPAHPEFPVLPRQPAVCAECFKTGINRLLLARVRGDLCRLLRARIRDLFPKAIVCPECAKRGLHVEAADPRCELCRGGWVVWEYRIRMANGYELRAWSNVDHAREARRWMLKG